MNERSKFLSFLLRHRPEAKGLKLDRDGWASMEDLVKSAGFTIAEMKSIVELDPKQRYSISEDGKKIRANQGHSTSQVRLTFAKAIPPPTLYHGTTKDAAEGIKKSGIKPMKRHYVHLTAEEQEARDVGGRRRGDVAVFEIDAAQMLTDGIIFFKSENGVWLVSSVDSKYIKVKV
jgi:putative RNA 2'-phosphotransferase